MTLCSCGRHAGKLVLGGGFQFATTHGVPLYALLDRAEALGVTLSLPHYFASAIEHGWDDTQAFSKLQEALVDRGDAAAFPKIKQLCLVMFMQHALPGRSAVEVARAMRESLEQKIQKSA